MLISSAYGTAYLKAADLQDRNVSVVIHRIAMETVGDDNKPVIYFRGKEKGLVLNKTNANNIAHAYGDETDEWIGQPIVLYPTIVDYQGRSVDAIRVKVPAKRPAPQNGITRTAPPPPAPPAAAATLDDEIPF